MESLTTSIHIGNFMVLIKTVSILETMRRRINTCTLLREKKRLNNIIE